MKGLLLINFSISLTEVKLTDSSAENSELTPLWARKRWNYI